MQVNPVHALIGLLRTEAQRGILGREQKLQLNALADILLEAKDAKDRLGKLEEAIQKGELKQAGIDRPTVEKPQVSRPGWPDFEHEADRDVNPRDFAVRVGNATSDAIARSLTERHGRTWDSYPTNDNSDAAKAGPRGTPAPGTKQRAHHDPHADMPPGFAFPYQPTVEDVEHALRTGQGWPHELGEEVRLRILRETQKQDREDTASYPFWPYVLAVMLAAAIVLWII